MSRWTFLTNHARVLLCIARDPSTRIRDMAACAEITERAAHRIVDDLVEGGYLTRHHQGRRCFYEVHGDLPLRHPHEEDHDVGEILSVLLAPRQERSRKVTAGDKAPPPGRQAA